MTNDSDGSGGSGPDLGKNPYHDPTAAYPAPDYGVPVNPYPVDQFTPYPWGPPAPQYGYPPQAAVGAPLPGALAATRALGAVALVGALLLIAYGWLTFASFETKGGDTITSTVNGWGQVFVDGDQINLPTGSNGSPYIGVFIPVFVIPVVILGLLVMCNIGRFGNSIAIFVLAVLHFLLSLIFLAVPSMCILFEADVDAEVFESTNDFTTGPGAILTTITLLVVAGTSLAGIILGRKKVYPQSPPSPALSGGYQG